MMDHLEDELRRALSRVEPPEGFAHRVLAATAKPAAPWFRSPASRWAMAAAACLLLAAGAAQYRQQRIEARGETAKAQLMLALRITGGKLQEVRAKVIHMEKRL